EGEALQAGERRRVVVDAGGVLRRGRPGQAHRRRARAEPVKLERGGAGRWDGQDEHRGGERDATHQYSHVRPSAATKSEPPVEWESTVPGGTLAAAFSWSRETRRCSCTPASIRSCPSCH